MRSLRRASTIVLVVLLLGALLAPGALATQPDKQVPLKGDFVGVGVEFSGNFSHLGRFDGEVTFSAFPFAEATWTAANGDTVTNESEIAIDFMTGAYVQDITITGGTGRFADATGGATVTGTIDLGTGAYDGHLVGTISQPGPRS